MVAVLALASALGFGVADFLGGLASRRAPALAVTLLSQVVGAILVVIVAPALAAPATGTAIMTGAVAGLGGAGGLVLYLRALSVGPMGVTAPVAAVVGAAVPITAGLLAGERPGLLATLGIAAGVAATVLVSRPADRGASLRASDPVALRRGVLLAVGAGALFGLFFVALDAAPADAGLWPLVGARGSGVALLVLLAVVRRPARPDAPGTRLALVSGVLDMAANVLFLLATQRGLLVLTAVLTSLYPVVVVLLARQVLGERLDRGQLTGVVLALVAVVMIAV